ncbi:MAG: acyl carrier protein [Bacteroidia bacterium]
MEAKFLQMLEDVLEISDRKLLLSDKFRDYEEWDSLAFLSLIAAIDEEFDVIIEGRDFKKLITNADIIEAIYERQS